MRVAFVFACLAIALTGAFNEQTKKCYKEHNTCIKKMEEQGSDFFQARSRCGALFLKCGVEPGCIKKCNKNALECLKKDDVTTSCVTTGNDCINECKAYKGPYSI